MRGLALGMLVGVAGVHQLPELPALSGAALLILSGVFYRFLKPFRPVFAVALGASLALLQAQSVLESGLASDLEGVDLTVVGTIADLPAQLDRRLRFEFDLESVAHAGAAVVSAPRRVRLSWYHAESLPRPGERWRFTVRLKRPHGFMNPGGFDYEGWLFARGIRAIGYVRAEPPAERLAPAQLWGVDALRQQVVEALPRAAPGSRHLDVLTALTVGERSGIGPERWEVLLRTGTNHLMAISGLHIGLVAGMVYGLVGFLWRRFPRATERWPAARAASAAAGLAGLAYALLAGFSLPTQRALIMLAVVLGALASGRALRPTQGLAVALAGCLVIDPRAPLSPGFWLSFGAVAIILYVMAGRLVRPGRVASLLRIQWVLGVGLLVPLLWLFGQAPLVSPIANLVAVPWVSVLVVPPALLAVLLLPWAPVLAGLCLGFADLALSALWPVLEALAALPGTQWQTAPAGAAAVTLGIAGVALLLAPRGWPARWLGAVFLLPVLWPGVDRPEEGALRLTVLDVGQGLAAVVQTRRHTLVFDAGPRYGERFDAGSAAVVPFLRAQGVRRVDRLVVSHGDTDHAGGVPSVIDALAVDSALLGPGAGDPGPGGLRCERGQAWVWDAVQFRVLHPPPGSWAGSENDGSCVIRVDASGGSLLLVADIEAEVEQRLVSGQREDLDVDLLLVPHHGSRSSSSEAFLQAASPQLAVLSAGYRNRYGLPHPQVMARYRELGVEVRTTALEGAVDVQIDSERGLVTAPAYRGEVLRYWHWRP
jgi:competence protein ComEC